MSKFILLVAIIFSPFANADFNLDVNWNKNKTKTVTLDCEEKSQTMCQYICKSPKQCVVKEEFCYNCVGNDLFIVNFYKNIGNNISNAGYDFHWSKLIGPLMNKNFITLKADSIYNIISDYGSKGMKKKFRNLCPGEVVKDPIVFVEVDRNRLPTDFMFVVCDQKIYELTQQQQLYTAQIGLN